MAASFSQSDEDVHHARAGRGHPPERSARRIFVGSAATSRDLDCRRAEAEADAGREVGGDDARVAEEGAVGRARDRRRARPDRSARSRRGGATPSGSVRRSSQSGPVPTRSFPRRRRRATARAPASRPSTTTTSKLVGATGTLVRLAACLAISWRVARRHAPICTTPIASRVAGSESVREPERGQGPPCEREELDSRGRAARRRVRRKGEPPDESPGHRDRSGAEENVEEERVGSSWLRLRVAAVRRARRVQTIEVVVRGDGEVRRPPQREDAGTPEDPGSERDMVSRVFRRRGSGGRR